MADSYFPSLTFKLNPLIDRFYSATQADRLAGMLQAIEDAYGPHDVPPGMRRALTDEFQEGLEPLLQQALVNNQVVDPLLSELNAKITEVLASDADSKLDAMKLAITAAYGSNTIPANLFNDLTAAYQPTDPNKLSDLKLAIAPYYVAESMYPALAGLKWRIKEVFEDDMIVGGCQTHRDECGVDRSVWPVRDDDLRTRHADGPRHCLQHQSERPGLPAEFANAPLPARPDIGIDVYRHGVYRADQ